MTALLVSLLLAQAYYTPAEAQALFQEANAAYGQGDLAGACERYERLVAHGRGSADVLYNLGTAYLAQGKMGEAVLDLERARRGGTDTSDIDANLALARTHLVDQVTGDTAEEPFLERLRAAGPMGSWAWGAAALLAFGGAALFVSRLARAGWLAALGALSLALALPVGGVFAAERFGAEDVREGVVMEATAPAHELPDAKAKVSFEVHAGLKVRMVQDSGDYVRIRLPNGLEAWALRTAVTPI